MQVRFKTSITYKANFYTVYNVRDDKNGHPHFLIYINNQWEYISAKHLMPAEEDK